METYAIVNNIFRHDLEQYNGKFNDNHLLLLVYMQKFKTYSGEMNFCYGWMFDELNINNNKNLQQELISCIGDLIELNLIELLNSPDKINRNTRLQVEICDYDNRFTQVLLSEYDKIFELDIDIRMKKTMLFLYTDIASWIDKKGYCYTSYQYFKRDLQTTSDNRINSSLLLLKENNIINYENSGQVVINGKVEQGNNIYVLCSDKKHKNNLAKGLENRRKFYQEHGAKVFRNKTANTMRSLKQRKNNLDKKYYESNITSEEIGELRKVEQEYYKFIKLDKEKLDEIDFVTFDLETGEILEVAEDVKVVEFELEEVEDVDADVELEEILNIPEDAEVEELNEEDIIDNLFTSKVADEVVDKVVEDNIKNVFVKRKPKEVKKFDYEKFVDKDISDLINDDFINFEEIFG